MNKTIMLAVLAGAVAGLAPAQAQETKSASSWADTVKFGGDLRLRHEYIDKEGSEERNRWRYRARLGVTAAPSEDVTVVLRLSSGQDADPVSSNQTFDDAFSRKDVYFDLAYLDWHPANLPGVDFVGGKMEMPFVTVGDLVWDGDLNPEGVAVKAKLGGDGLDFLVNLGSFWVDERSATTEDAMLHGGQVALKIKQDDFHALAGVAYYLYENLEGFGTLVDATKGFGNSTTGGEEDPVTGETSDVLYATGFEILDAMAEVGFKPFAIYGDVAVNNDADEDDTGYMVGFKVGKTKNPGDFDFNYNYRELEANAVLGAFTDSDFIGGGTDGKGHKFSLGYQVTKVLKANLTYFMNEIGLDGDSKDYDRVQLDLAAKF